MNGKHQSKGRGLDQHAEQGIFQLRFESRFTMFQKNGSKICSKMFKNYGCCGRSICLANDFWNELPCAWFRSLLYTDFHQRLEARYQEGEHGVCNSLHGFLGHFLDLLKLFLLSYEIRGQLLKWTPFFLVFISLSF